ncbi:MAG: triose-phosphate isomerase [Acidobacteria bacterium]|nr:triose-phosphate isomerase [Acidobacteriota bacterium]
MRYSVANWKMNLPPEGIAAYCAALAAAAGDGPRLVVAPPFPYLHEIRGLAVAGQNCAEKASGAFTGEISAAMLRERGAQFVILGHSERRTLFGETDAQIARKLAIALENGLTPILCIGEDLNVRDSGRAEAFLADQLKAAAAGVTNGGDVVIAYEPIWAIGTGRNATGKLCAETTQAVRESVRRFWPERYENVPVLYGGSVTPDNVTELVAEGEIDGFLVGGASLDSGKFLAIHRALGKE